MISPKKVQQIKYLKYKTFTVIETFNYINHKYSNALT